MKRIRLPRGFTLNAVFVYIALFCVTTFALLEHTSISIGAFSSVKLPLMYLGFFCLVTQIKTISRCLLKKRYFYVLLALAILCILLLITILANQNNAIGGTPLYGTVRLILYLVELFFLMIVLAETGRAKVTLNFIFWYLVLIAIVNDALLFSRILTFGTQRHESYLVGSKFSVVYLHMNLLSMWAIRSKWSSRTRKLPRWVVILAAAFIVGVSLRVDCMSGIIGCVALVILFGMVDSPRRNKLIKFTSPSLLVTGLVFSVVFVFVVDRIMEIPLVQFVVEDILKRDTSITGRTNIYETYINKMEGRWLTGFGFGNGNEVAVNLFGYENVQNALLQWVLQVGIPATGGLVAVMIQVFRRIHHRRLHNMEMILPLVALIYMYVFLGTVETTFNMAFIMWFALIFMLANEKLQQPAYAPQAAGAARSAA